MSKANVRALHYGSDRDRKGLAAVLALVDARSRALALQLGYSIAHDAAARTNRPLRPKYAFEMGARRVIIMINLVVEIDFRSELEAGHDALPLQQGNTTSCDLVRQADSSHFRARIEPFQGLASGFPGDRNAQAGRIWVRHREKPRGLIRGDAAIERNEGARGFPGSPRRQSPSKDGRLRRPAGLAMTARGNGQAGPPRQEPHPDSRVKLGVGPAISNSVSSVFKEMRRHLRVCVNGLADLP